MEAVMNRLQLSRNKSVLLVALLGFLVGIPLDINMRLFGLFADLVTVYLVPFGAVIAAFVFFWIYGVERLVVKVNCRL
ncbi:neurotransmitter:Na+ symporter, NSS family [Desulforamulus putei DSM 12395]|uniref:Neurotransmitter:Na+ symporter, NSS family n=1 Tax=Desulforamulus putei DSM 12395 TaxID=1121429 RepID=A0A1M4VKI5_9FIRM|nr:hypothetical protein [Desulforamulus putei]SHE69418.1 neurotransmitter:Na+ symporter, NSS family [Desulforamulus putei DSM 12395]